MMMMGDKSINFQPKCEESSLKLNINGDGDDDDDDANVNDHRMSDVSSISKEKQHQSNKQFLKYVSLVTLTIQNASLTLFMRAARTQNELFSASTAVIMSELLKLLTCLVMVYRDEGMFNYLFVQ